MFRQFLHWIKSPVLAALLLLPARIVLAQGHGHDHGHGHEEYHWLDHEYREELYLQLGAIVVCVILLAIIGWAVKRLKRRAVCKG